MHTCQHANGTVNSHTPPAPPSQAYDEWASRMLADPEPPWAQREQRAVGR